MKHWKKAIPIEDWQKEICKRDKEIGQNVIYSLIYICTNAGNKVELGIEELEKMSGKEIIDNIKQFINSCEPE